MPTFLGKARLLVNPICRVKCALVCGLRPNRLPPLDLEVKLDDWGKVEAMHAKLAMVLELPE